MGLPYMPMFWGDYWRDTTHLSDAEHVSYLRLISHYWQHGGLPQEDSRLARIAGRSDADWSVMRPMLQAFFKDCWTHPRIDRELQKQKMIQESNVERAKKAAASRWNKNQSDSSTAKNDKDASSMLQASVEQSLSDAIHIHSHIHNHNTEPVINNIRSQKLADGVFAEFWKSYPRKVGKAAAEKAWTKALGASPADVILSGLYAYVWPNDPQYIPHPATWLNQHRWKDEPPPRKMTLAEKFARKAMELEQQEDAPRPRMIDLLGD